MIKPIYFICLLLFANFCFSQSIKIEKLTLEDYQFDLAILDRLIDKQHPNPYEFISKDQQLKFKNKAIENLKKNTSFFNFMKCLNRFGDGHLLYTTKEEFNEYMKNTPNYFPFPVIVRDGRMFINIKGNELGYGTEILSIQNKSVKDIVGVLNTYIHGDGYSMTNTEARLSDFFALAYKLFIESNTTKFTIQYISNKQNQTQQITLDAIDYYEMYRRQFLSVQPINILESKETIATRFYKSKKTGVITVNSFDLKESSAYKKINKFFKKINDEQFKNVIIDLRNNEGGSPNMAALLFSFIMDSNFKNSFNFKAKNITFLKENLSDAYGNPVSNNWIERDELFFYQRFNKNEEGVYIGNERLNEGVIENFPPDKDHFKGNVYLMVGGKTFSAAVFFAKLFRDYKRGKIIGVETGGNANNTFAGYFSYYTLPRTKILVRIPITELYFGDGNSKSYHGVIPEITVPTNKFKKYLIKEKDPELQYLMDHFIK